MLPLRRVLVTPLLSRYTFLNKFCPKEVRFILRINTHTDDMTSAKFNRTAVQVEAAQARISPHVTTALVEKVTLESAHGRTLAETIHAPHPYPFFRRSGMDGYAIVSSDTTHASSDEQVWLRVVDEIPCGYTSDLPITPGTTARIMTGAQVPEGADAVVMLEMTESREQDGEQWIALKRRIQPNANITPIGLEVQEGQLLLEAGTIIQAGEQSVLATFGVADVSVFRRPKVAILQRERNCWRCMSLCSLDAFVTATVICSVPWWWRQVANL